MLPGASYLKIMNDGFEFSALYPRHLVRWKDVEEFAVMTHKYLGLITVNKMVGWNYVPGSGNRHAGRSFNKAITGIEAGLPDTYGLKVDDLLAIMIEYWEKNIQEGTGENG